MSATSASLGNSARETERSRDRRWSGGSFLRLLWIELKRSQGYWLLPLMVALGILMLGIYGSSYSYDGVVLWKQLSFATLHTYAVIGPLAAALAAWLVGRDRRRHVDALVATAPGSGFQRDVLVLLVSAIWGLAGYLGVCLWFGWQGITQAVWGQPEYLLIITGALAIALFAGIGVMAGRYVPGRFASIVALAGTFLLTIGASNFVFKTEYVDQFGQSSGYSQRFPLRLLMPWGLTDANLDEVWFSMRFVPDSLLWLAGLIGVTVSLMALLRRRDVLSGVCLILALGVTVYAIQPLISREAREGFYLQGAPVDFTWTCESASGIEVCLHPAYASEMDETLDFYAKAVGPLAGLDGVPARWMQSSPLSIRDPAIGLLGVGQLQWELWSIGFDLFEPQPSGGVPARGAMIGEPLFEASQVVILSWLAGRVEEYTGRDESYGSDATADGSAIWMFPFDMTETDGAEVMAATDRFSALSSEQQRAWLEANWTALRAGELALEDLP